jgi:hypothetical protein
MQSGRLGVPDGVKHRSRRGWILLAIIVFGGVSAIGLWYEIGIPGAEHGKPPPPTKKSVKAEAERMPSKPEKPVVSVPVKTSADGSKLENQKIKQMIEQVQQMRNEMGQVENQH